MSEFDRELSEALRSNGRLEPERAGTLRKEAVRMFDRKLKIVKWVTWGGIAFFLSWQVAGLVLLIHAASTKLMILGALVAVFGGQGEVLAKLWYWTVNTKLSTSKRLKELQLQIAELSSRKAPD